RRTCHASVRAHSRHRPTYTWPHSSIAGSDTLGAHVEHEFVEADEPPEVSMPSDTSRSEPPPRARPDSPAPRSTRRITRRGWVVFTLLPLLAVAATYLGLTGGGELAVTGIAAGALLGADEAEPTLEISTGRSLEDLTVTLDGRPLTVTPGEPGEASVLLTDLADGPHTVAVVASRPFPHSALESSV